MTGARTVLKPTSLAEAVAALAVGAVPMAGATWIMRAHLRGEALAPCYMALGGVAGLREIVVSETEIGVGGAVTHLELAASLRGLDDCAGLADAAAQAANPAVRGAATLGGNLCAEGFAASDLAPALIAAAAEVEIHAAGGARRVSAESFLEERATWPGGWLLSRIVVPRAGRISAHARLPLRKAGDYPVAIVSVSQQRSPAGLIEAPGIAVGSVEAVARRWTGLERALAGQPLDPDAAAEAASRAIGEFTGRDGVEAPGWYRTQVLPSLVRAAFQSLQAQA